MVDRNTDIGRAILQRKYCEVVKAALDFPPYGISGAKEAAAREAWRHFNLQLALDLMPPVCAYPGLHSLPFSHCAVHLGGNSGVRRSYASFQALLSVFNSFVCFLLLSGLEVRANIASEHAQSS